MINVSSTYSASAQAAFCESSYFVLCSPSGLCCAGVGKSELAKTLASYYFGSVEAMVRFDMSEYMERHTVSKLIGSPPGGCCPPSLCLMRELWHGTACHCLAQDLACCPWAALVCPSC